ncbi:hypothetical protein KKR91_08865 [Arthrobacter jiangjiafuii]|uniref:DUF1648 domain-containing protein n=1 Tax=Arthrobacter jiangjiafuii TaxID=2817475 RepID=A0A975M2G1_9MICC|nr:hypothetical protein [Arthrobacter jiangjiafuii]MBP3043111.1 hypothetical protein [Arthrobacter jiangjiafuii]QWC08670.1 hypothetical protein KKR91_08865 [Arthrobacter jiangjiafuii]
MTSNPMTDVGHSSPGGARLWWGAVIPTAGIILGAAVVLLGWYPLLPELLANQWKDGAVSTVRPFLATVAPILASAVAALFCLLILHWTGKLDGWGRRLSIAALTALPAFLAGTTLLLAGTQRGLPDPYLAPDPMWNAAWLAGVALAWGVVACLLAGGAPLTAADRDASAPELLPLADGERALWMRTETGWVFLVAGVGGGLVMVLSGLLTPFWILSLLGAVLIVLGLPLSRWIVTVSSAGVDVRSVAGLVRLETPVHPDAVARADNIAGPLEVLGWGLRIGAKGSKGLILRNGEVLAVNRPGARSFTVSVKDAATGAALFNAEVQRQSG